LRVIAQAGGIVFRGHDRDLSVLLVTSKKIAGNWIFPKGHVEPGETEAAAALRETREEAGVDGQIVGPAGAPVEFGWWGKRYRVQYFLIRPTSESPETDGRTKQWLRFDEALARLSDNDIRQRLLDARPGMVRDGTPEPHDA
jgi:8-oxo-dGTP pyrophosphatase MutT (NUDIX family)